MLVYTRGRCIDAIQCWDRDQDQYKECDVLWYLGCLILYCINIVSLHVSLYISYHTWNVDSYPMSPRTILVISCGWCIRIGLWFHSLCYICSIFPRCYAFLPWSMYTMLLVQVEQRRFLEPVMFHLSSKYCLMSLHDHLDRSLAAELKERSFHWWLKKIHLSVHKHKVHKKWCSTFRDQLSFLQSTFEIHICGQKRHDVTMF